MTSVGDDAVKTRQPLLDLDNQGTVFLHCFFGGRHGWWSSEVVLCRVENLDSAQGGNDRITQCDSVYMVRHPRGGLHSTKYTHCCLWKVPHQKTNRFIRRCHPYARKSASRAVLSRMQLTLHATRPTPHGASRLVLAMSAWSVKPDVLRPYSTS